MNFNGKLLLVLSLVPAAQCFGASILPTAGNGFAQIAGTFAPTAFSVTNFTMATFLDVQGFGPVVVVSGSPTAASALNLPTPTEAVLLNFDVNTIHLVGNSLTVQTTGTPAPPPITDQALAQLLAPVTWTFDLIPGTASFDAATTAFAGNYQFVSAQSAVPEPVSISLVGLGLMGFGACYRLRRKAAHK